MGTQVTESTLEQLEPILRQDIARSLSKDEQLVACLVSKQLNVVNVYVITNARLIRAMALTVPFTKLISSPQIESLSLAEIVGIATSDTWVTANGPGGTRITCELDSKQRAQAFASSLQSAKNHQKAGLSQSKSPADRLRELARLHSEGLISESEFQQKRQEIMRQL